MIRQSVLAASIACLSACAVVTPLSEPYSPEVRGYSAEIGTHSLEPSVSSLEPSSTVLSIEPESTSSPLESTRPESGPSLRGPAEPLFLELDSELQTQGGWAGASPQSSAKGKRPVWKPGQVLLQGFFGAEILNKVELSGGTSPDSEADGDTYLPAIGGGGQWKLAGDKVEFGVEGMISFAWQANATAFSTAGGGATVAISFGLLLVDLYGGPFVNVWLGDSTRLYLAAGPLLEWANYDQYYGANSDTATGFGGGGYARTGVEFRLPSQTLIGLGVRWSKSSISLSNNLGNLDLEGYQAVLTVTRGF